MSAGVHLYHRLGRQEAVERLHRLQRSSEVPTDSFDAPIELAGAAPRATGGTPISLHSLRTLRSRASETLGNITQLDPHQRPAEFDRRLSTVLWDELDMVPAEAASMEVWWFLGLVILPGTAAFRFSFENADRHVGPPRRHVLRRLWYRRQALGGLLDVDQNPLSEDELVQITERSLFVSDPRLAQAAARSILQFDGPNRSHSYSRPFLRDLQAMTGTVLVGALSDAELGDVIDRADRRTRDRLS